MIASILLSFVSQAHAREHNLDSYYDALDNGGYLGRRSGDSYLSSSGTVDDDETNWDPDDFPNHQSKQMLRAEPKKESSYKKHLLDDVVRSWSQWPAPQTQKRQVYKPEPSYYGDVDDDLVVHVGDRTPADEEEDVEKAEMQPRAWADAATDRAAEAQRAAAAAVRPESVRYQVFDPLGVHGATWAERLAAGGPPSRPGSRPASPPQSRPASPKIRARSDPTLLSKTSSIDIMSCTNAGCLAAPLAVCLISLFAGIGVALAVLHVRHGASTSKEETLLGA